MKKSFFGVDLSKRYTSSKVWAFNFLKRVGVWTTCPPLAKTNKFFLKKIKKIKNIYIYIKEQFPSGENPGPKPRGEALEWNWRGWQPGYAVSKTDAFWLATDSTGFQELGGLQGTSVTILPRGKAWRRKKKCGCVLLVKNFIPLILKFFKTWVVNQSEIIKKC